MDKLTISKRYDCSCVILSVFALLLKVDLWFGELCC